MNKFSSIMARLLCPDPVLFWAYMLPILYWTYLTLTTNFVLVFDSENYFQLAHLFYDPGQWTKYFITGPNREPLYPLLIAVSMQTGKCLGVSYTYPLKIFSFGLLAATMALIQQVLKIINTNRWIVAITILYTGFSPILINSALCLYSEIATFPWLIGVVLMSFYFIRSLHSSALDDPFAAIGLGACLGAFTFVKGIGEGLYPLFLCWLFFYGWRRSGLGILSFLRRSKIKILLVLFVYYVPLFSYKSLNYAYNGNFSLTNRGTLNLYGNINRRAQNPLTLNNFLSHLATVPVSYDLCSHFFPVPTCAQWSMSASDETYLTRIDQLNKQNLTSAQIQTILNKGTLGAFFSHPLEQTVYFIQDGMKMFFWETTGSPFVVYPPWLENLFLTHNVLVCVCLGAGSFCLAGFITACFMLKNELILITIVLTALLIFLFSFFDIIHRYAIIAAPLMILLNALCLSVLTAKASVFFASKDR